MPKEVHSLSDSLVFRRIRRLFATFRREPPAQPAQAVVSGVNEPTQKLVLKIAETKEELEACFQILHDAYVESGFMKPDPSGMRVTIYHALPTTTTLCAKCDGEVVGTISLVRESALGLPLQRIFDLTAVREKGGNIAEVSALAVHPKFRRTGHSVSFPLMKFMVSYCTTFFDTRHIVIAVNPAHIKMYESILLFTRLTENVVESYDFVNGAPAVGATLDLKEAPEVFRKHYSSKAPSRNLHEYFFTPSKVPNVDIQFPTRRFFTTNDPVLTPDLLDYFYNVRTSGFRKLSARKRALLHLIYDLPAYRAVLPPLPASDSDSDNPTRRHQRFSVKCPGKLLFLGADGEQEIPIEVVEVSRYGFQVKADSPLPLSTWCETTINLGHTDVAHFRALTLRKNDNGAEALYGFQLGAPDIPWRKFVSALYRGTTYGDLDNATRFLE